MTADKRLEEIRAKLCHHALAADQLWDLANELLAEVDRLRAVVTAMRRSTDTQSKERDRLSQILAECCVLFGGIKISQDELPMRIRQIQREAKAAREKALEEAVKLFDFKANNSVIIKTALEYRARANEIRALMQEGK